MPITQSAGRRPCLSASAIMEEMGACTTLATGVGRHYVRLLAQYTADLALTTLPFGGIYYIGGVARAFTPWMARFGYDAAFTDMGRFSATSSRNSPSRWSRMISPP